jgi:hypothetical protein
MVGLLLEGLEMVLEKRVVLSVIISSICSFGNRNEVERIAFTCVGLKVVKEVRQETFTVFVEVDDEVRFRNISGKCST